MDISATRGHLPKQPMTLVHPFLTVGLLLHPYPMTAYISQRVAVEYIRAHATMQHNKGHRCPCVKHSTERVETQHKNAGVRDERELGRA